MIKKCHFLPIETRVQFKVCTMVFKYYNETAPNYINDTLTRKISLPCLRISDDKFLLKFISENQKYKDRKFSTAAPALWNKLTHDIRSSSTIGMFKKKLKTHLFKEYYENHNA